MMRNNQHKLPRLYVNATLSHSQLVALDADQWHYVRNVMRMEHGDELMVFNGIHGEWRAALVFETKKRICLKPLENTKPQTANSQLVYAFAPLKKTRLDYMVQKATELGAGILQPVITDHTINHKLKHDKLTANAIEAAEQCTMLSIPKICEPIKFDAFLDKYTSSHALIFCDEAATTASPITQIAGLRGQNICVLVGPEGGFSDAERKALLALDNVTTISLGPRVMRADTAAVAALTLVQAVIGDW